MATPATSSLEDLKPPTGLVRPPPEIRVIIEKTASYVSRRGAVFEDRIRANEGGNPKFSFLTPTDAYHGYYQWRLSEIKEGRGTDAAGSSAGIRAARKEIPQGPPKPPDYEFSAKMPRLSQKDLEVIRLTALFVARNGRGWMAQLAQREASNPQFQFLTVSHTFHTFFLNMIEEYKLVLETAGLDGKGTKRQEERTKTLQKIIADKFSVLDRAKQRAAYDKYMEAEKRKKAELEEKEKEEHARIDWGDFVVVETITFDDDDDNADLPPPAILSDLQYASLETKNEVSIGVNMRLEEAMPTDDTNMNYPAAQLTTGNQSGFSLPVHPGAPIAPQMPAGPQHPPQGTPAYDDSRIREREAEAERARQTKQAATTRGQIKIRENYVPGQKNKGPQQRMAICPNCKQSILIDEMDEHLRIETLDPRWKEQKSKADARAASTNMAQHDVANNLKRLASHRFEGSTGLSAEEEARRKKAALGPDAIPDTKAGPQMLPPGHRR